ncbi:bone morphogenetic protein 2-like [Venturia canescens]|uniref:bone morphogenetic protein 2-like n=1 Tax=Venturia canescens TaxID=32260 RepID=UPI001C9CDD6A|nr:bone morphogenetic protein 2-like [Venturia canescens]XP_043269329.1 bone morphogenetic protein 2-like [Venturia canescens]
MRSQKLDLFMSIVVVTVMIILRPISIYHWVDAYPSEMLEIDPETDSIDIPPWRIVDLLDKEAENEVVRFEESLEDLQKIFGIRSQTDKKTTNRRKIPPQFMMELYNTIADSSGVTHGKNPYNAKVVRSFTEAETPYSHVYMFNVSGLEINESVLEAELHLYRERTPLQRIHPPIPSKPGYLISVYQVVEGKSLAEPAEPDLHKLLNIHYVGAHAFGWQVFNVKQAVLAWVAGSPNLGLLVTVSNIFNEKVIIEFSRRNEYHNSKQPILVLFNDDGKESTRKQEKMTPHYYTYDNVSEEREVTSDEIDGAAENSQRRRQYRDSSTKPLNSVNPLNLNKEYSYGTQLGKEKSENGEADYFQREKKIDVDKKNEEKIEGAENFDDVDVFIPDLSLRGEKMAASNNMSDENEENSQDFMRHRRGASKRNRQEPEKKRSRKIVSNRRNKTPQMLSSMDIYERAMLRERMMTKSVRKYEGRQEESNPRGREKRSSPMTESTNKKKSKSYSNTERSTTECARHELYVDFKEIGLSTAIIAPKGYSAYHCQGMCNSPLSQDQQPTNHATVQGLVHKMGVLTDVHMPCCVPTKLLRTSILFFDDNENVVLKVYEDMVADRCGCR